MNFKRVMMILLAALLLPGLALAQTVTQATFEITKNFVDDNPAAVTVTLNCFTGLPLTQSQDITDTDGAEGVTFVVESFEDGALDCTVSEEDVVGYSIEAYDGTCNSDGEWEDVANGAENFCIISNAPNPVQVLVNKDWILDGEGGDQIDPRYKLTLWCEEPPYVNPNDVKGQSNTCVKHSGGVYEPDEPVGNNEGFCRIRLTDYPAANSSADLSYTALVIPYWDGGTGCWVEEEVWDSAVEVDNGCDRFGEDTYALNVEIGDADNSNECTITNTVFFEGIPTLSQYGMAIMALLMLGVGFVGFRRFV